ncbi:glycosyltransferase [Sporomusa acidovorans]|uniref:Streptomycin biosynthesis protein StrF domain-containing protein n=1 Tax=Sporomusa acidovorans (strain ATCC 49682 / DSM 3132 / Mol) TaxID=1123286 RepID=A0ABZ3J897_SPOA4|nr:glycosyltransferase [Sporomusa acidovorans]OZC19368.1 hypothetical protein SPACI_29580 [Sporomusa acidovorans DSM 3132]SDD79209.1 Glycosyltransferase like family protein [Sporomusa acidovorans]
MNNQQIAFISCVNDEDMYAKCLQYINHLELPKGYNYEKIAIRGAKALLADIIKSSAKKPAVKRFFDLSHSNRVLKYTLILALSLGPH